MKHRKEINPDWKIAFDLVKQYVDKDGVLLLSTDTIPGLSCSPFSEIAINRINAIKHREANKSFILLVSDENMLSKYIENPPPVLWEIIEAASEPLTLILPALPGFQSSIYGSDNTIGFRIVKEGFLNYLIFRLNHPLVSTSANISGDKFPSKWQDISGAITEKVDYLVNLTENGTGKPSSIIKLGKDSTISVIRK